MQLYEVPASVRWNYPVPGYEYRYAGMNTHTGYRVPGYRYNVPGALPISIHIRCRPGPPFCEPKLHEVSSTIVLCINYVPGTRVPGYQVLPGI